MRRLSLLLWLWVVVGSAISCSEQDELPHSSSGAGGAAAGGGGGEPGTTSQGGSGGSTSSGSGGGGGEGGTPWQPVESDWCTDEGWQGIDDGTCFYVPDGLADPAGLMVFLHGMMPPDTSATTQQYLVRMAADAHGFAALFPRGRKGLCTWDPSVEDWWCWPSSRESVDLHVASFIAEWDNAVALLEQHLEVSFTDPYVMGFSNGGYFSSYIALEGHWPLSGAGLVAAGRWLVETSLFPPVEQQAPVYIGVGALDQQDVQDSAENLAWILYTNDWLYDFVLHPNSGHELALADFASAWALWH